MWLLWLKFIRSAIPWSVRPFTKRSKEWYIFQTTQPEHSGLRIEEFCSSRLFCFRDRYKLESANVLRTLRCIIRALYKDQGGDKSLLASFLSLDTLYEMILSHSQFLDVILCDEHGGKMETKGTTNNWSRAVFCVERCMEELNISKRGLLKGTSTVKENCYTSQLKYVFLLEENVSRVIGQNFMTP